MSRTNWSSLLLGTWSQLPALKHLCLDSLTDVGKDKSASWRARLGGGEGRTRCGFQYSTSEDLVPGEQAYSAAGERNSAGNGAKPASPLDFRLSEITAILFIVFDHSRIRQF